MSVDESNPLYDACVGFMVAEKSETDSWEKVARFVQMRVVNGYGEEALLKAEFHVVEKQIKHDFKTTTLPTAWRTAKSTALAAAKHGVSLVDPSGAVKGKSATEDEVRALKTTDEKSLAFYVAEHLNRAAREVTGLRVDSFERAALDAALTNVSLAIGTIVDA